MPAGVRRQRRDRADLRDEPVDRVVDRVRIASGSEHDVRVQLAPEPAHGVGLCNPVDAGCSAGTWRAGGGSPADSAPLLPRRLTTAAITTATTRATPRPATARIDHRMRRFWRLGVTAAKQFRLDWLALRSRRCVRVRLGHACGAPVATGAPLFWHASDRRRLDRHQERRSHVVVARDAGAGDRALGLLPLRHGPGDAAVRSGCPSVPLLAFVGSTPEHGREGSMTEKETRPSPPEVRPRPTEPEIRPRPSEPEIRPQEMFERSASKVALEFANDVKTGAGWTTGALLVTGVAKQVKRHVFGEAARSSSQRDRPTAAGTEATGRTC
jgi:hypothetical protein